MATVCNLREIFFGRIFSFGPVCGGLKVCVHDCYFDWIPIFCEIQLLIRKAFFLGGGGKGLTFIPIVLVETRTFYISKERIVEGMNYCVYASESFGRLCVINGDVKMNLFTKVAIRLKKKKEEERKKCE